MNVRILKTDRDVQKWREEVNLTSPQYNIQFPSLVVWEQHRGELVWDLLLSQELETYARLTRR